MRAHAGAVATGPSTSSRAGRRVGCGGARSLWMRYRRLSSRGSWPIAAMNGAVGESPAGVTPPPASAPGLNALGGGSCVPLLVLSPAGGGGDRHGQAGVRSSAPTRCSSVSPSPIVRYTQQLP
jgi:hypothetical protein